MSMNLLDKEEEGVYEEEDTGPKQPFCLEEADPGVCKSEFNRWYYSPSEGICKEYTYSGCGGNRNSFMSYETCMGTCHNPSSGSGFKDLLPMALVRHDYMADDSNVQNQYQSDDSGGWVPNLVADTVADGSYGATADPWPHHDTSAMRQPGMIADGQTWTQDSRGGWPDQDAIDCQLTEWSSWSGCSNPCGRGWMQKTRQVVVDAQNGGRVCPRKMEKRRKCRGNRCNAGSGY
jgi:hypothetical protein